MGKTLFARILCLMTDFISEDLQEAIVDYTKAVELDPQSVYAYRNRGLARELVNNFYGACRDWRKAVDLGDKDAAEWVKKQC